MTDKSKPKHTPVGEIPAEWEVVSLARVLNRPRSGYSATGEDAPASEGECGVLKLSCIANGRLNSQENKLVRNSAVLRTPVRGGTVVISRSNTPELVGAVAYVSEGHPNLFLSDLMWELSAKCKAKLNMRWLCYALCSDTYRRHIAARANGTSASMRKITKGSLLGIRIALPPLPEQRKIAEILSTWDRAIEQTEKLIDAKERLKKGLMQRLLTGELRFPEFGAPSTEIGDLPPDWDSVKAGSLFQRRSKKGFEDEPVLSVTQDQGVVLRDSLERKINMTDANIHTYKLVEPGDFVISLRSFQGGLEYSTVRGVVSPAYHVIRAKRPICDDFYRHYFKSFWFVGHLASAVIGIRDGKQVSFGDFEFLRLPYPKLAEQERIASVLNACDSEIALLRRNLDAFQQQKKGLMQKLLTGKVRVEP